MPSRAVAVAARVVKLAVVAVSAGALEEEFACGFALSFAFAFAFSFASFAVASFAASFAFPSLGASSG